jgi:hypothetical protein
MVTSLQLFKGVYLDYLDIWSDFLHSIYIILSCTIQLFLKKEIFFAV